MQPDYFPAGQVAVPAMAGDRSGARHVDVRRHHGAAAGAEAAGLHRDPAAPATSGAASAALRLFGRHPVRDAGRRADGAGGDADPDDRRRGDPARARFGLERAAARRRRDSRRARRGGCIGGTPCSGLRSACVAWAVSLSLALWMLPVVLGLALAIPLALLTGRRWAGGLLRTPEDVAPPPVVARAAGAATRMAGAARARRGATVARSAAAGRRTWRCCRRRVGRASTRSMPRSRWRRAKLDEAETLENAARGVVDARTDRRARRRRRAPAPVRAGERCVTPQAAAIAPRSASGLPAARNG